MNYSSGLTLNSVLENLMFMKPSSREIQFSKDRKVLQKHLSPIMDRLARESGARSFQARLCQRDGSPPRSWTIADQELFYSIGESSDFSTTPLLKVSIQDDGDWNPIVVFSGSWLNCSVQGKNAEASAMIADLDEAFAKLPGMVS